MSPSSVCFLPETAPFSLEQRAWVNGYLAGLMSPDRLTVPGAEPKTATSTNLLFLFGSQTGSAEALAARFAEEARQVGFNARALGMEDYTKIDFRVESFLAIVTSTYGDGEMPDNAQEFWNLLNGDTAPSLDQVKFSVLSLGDSSYTRFCQAGKDFDRRLCELGAERVQDRCDCEVDYEEKAKSWFDGFMKALDQQEIASVIKNAFVSRDTAYALESQSP